MLTFLAAYTGYKKPKVLPEKAVITNVIQVTCSCGGILTPYHSSKGVCSMFTTEFVKGTLNVCAIASLIRLSFGCSLVEVSHL